MSKRQKTIYTLEFKQSSAKLGVESDKSISQTAKDLDLNDSTLYNWIAKFYPNRQTLPQDKDSLQQELKQLRQENARLTQERDILKKAAAYFASEM